MKSLLIINSSARATRSVTRQLTDRFATAWQARQPDGELILRDVGLAPVPAINESWIASAFSDPSKHTPEMQRALATSEELIEELFRASAIVVGVPMYNFGMPGQLKAYIDQIIRVGRTFNFAEPGAENPYIPLIPSKPVVIVTSKGADGYDPGQPFAHHNFLEPHLEHIFRFLGFEDLSFVRVGFEEEKGERFDRSKAEAAAAVDALVARITDPDAKELAAA